jgi:phosphoribosylformylglycinamidine cyclo-ligase
VSKTHTYKDAGVDIDDGSDLTRRIKGMVKPTFRPEVVSEIGGFAGLFSLNVEGYGDPLLVSSTDGVGTKLKVAFMMKKHDTIGVDLVAMCANDILTLGAEPLFFLDYLSTSRLEVAVAEEVIGGIVSGCCEAGCALLGGETAEMPSFYRDKEYDVAGFIVGIVDRGKVTDGSQITIGDTLVGISSSGLHSNGYSLARKVIFEHLKLEPDHRPEGFESTVGEELLTPTKIYVKAIHGLLKDFHIKGMVHVTGGGLIDNISRILPRECAVVLDRGSWTVPPIFTFLQKAGNIKESEMLCTFNCGIGYVLVVAPEQAEGVTERVKAMGHGSSRIGNVTRRDGDKPIRLA